VVFSADGRVLAAGGGKDARIWETATGLVRRRFTGHQGPVHAIALSADGTRLAVATQDTTALVWDVTGRAGTAVELNDSDLKGAWDDLALADGDRSGAALARLAADPQRSLPWLRRHLRPAVAPDAETVQKLVADLDSKTFTVRKKAQQALEELDEAAAPALRRALKTPRSAEQQRHIEELLEKAADLSPGRLRQVRAVEALERIGTAEALALLTELAGGAEARLTREARASKDRLAARR
jgi:hypothetical protein